MRIPCYINIKQAQQVLADMGIELTERQVKRATEKDIHGRRKLPFFIDPIEKKLTLNVIRQLDWPVEFPSPRNRQPTFLARTHLASCDRGSMTP